MDIKKFLKPKNGISNENFITNPSINSYQEKNNENECEFKHKRKTSTSSLTLNQVTNRPLAQQASLISTFKKTVSVNQITNLMSTKMDLRSDDENSKNRSSNLLKEKYDHEQNIFNSKRKQSINQEVKVTDLRQHEYKTRRRTAEFLTDNKNKKEEATEKIAVLPPTLPKTRPKSVATIISDLKQTSLIPKVSQSAAISDDAEKTPELQIIKSNSDTSSSSGSSTSSQQPNDKSRTRNKTITQLNTRRSLNSCLNSILSFASKENNNENSEL